MRWQGLMCVGGMANTWKALHQVFPGLYGLALGTNGGALCVSMGSRRSVCVCISPRVILTELTVSQGRPLFSHLSLTAVVNRLRTSLLEVLTAAAFCLLRDAFFCWGTALISVPSFWCSVKPYSILCLPYFYPDMSERFFFFLEIMYVKCSL